MIEMERQWQSELVTLGGRQIEQRFFYDAHGHKCYETQIYTAGGGMIPESKLEEYNQRQQERRAAELSAAQTPEPVRPFCPLAAARNISDRRCNESCAFFDGNACGIVSGSTVNQGGICPMFGRQCRSDCAMIGADGCRFLLTNRRKEET